MHLPQGFESLGLHPCHFHIPDINASATRLLSMHLSPQGFESLGFVRKDGKTIYREWAPGAKAAALIGDFNNWECAWMEKDEWGVWSVELPAGERQQQWRQRQQQWR
jgi:1,4-alpha-glucan branching enzyme